MTQPAKVRGVARTTSDVAPRGTRKRSTIAPPPLVGPYQSLSYPTISDPASLYRPIPSSGLSFLEQLGKEWDDAAADYLQAVAAALELPPSAATPMPFSAFEWQRTELVWHRLMAHEDWIRKNLQAEPSTDLELSTLSSAGDPPEPLAITELVVAFFQEVLAEPRQLLRDREADLVNRYSLAVWRTEIERGSVSAKDWIVSVRRAVAKERVAQIAGLDWSKAVSPLVRDTTSYLQWLKRPASRAADAKAKDARIAARCQALAELAVELGSASLLNVALTSFPLNTQFTRPQHVQPPTAS